MTTESKTDQTRAVRIKKDQVALFRERFAGNPYMFARYYNAKNPKRPVGYTLVKDAEGRPLPVGDRDIMQHCTGKQPIGIYPLIDDHICRFFALDFDNHDVQTVMKIFRTFMHYGLTPFPATSTRRGFHLYFFFSDPIEARKIRAMAQAVLVREGFLPFGENAKQHGIDFFPAQDAGEIGNLIRPPMSWGPYRDGAGGITQGKNCPLDFFGRPLQLEESWAMLQNAVTHTPQDLDEAIVRNRIKLGAYHKKTYTKKVGVVNTEATLFTRVLKTCQRVRDIVTKLQDPDTSLEVPYNDWFNLLHILAPFGDVGRAIAHQISECDKDRYDHEVLDYQFDKILQHDYSPPSCKKALACSLNPFIDCGLKTCKSLPYYSPLLAVVDESTEAADLSEFPLTPPGDASTAAPSKIGALSALDGAE